MPDRLGRMIVGALCAMAILAGCSGATNSGGDTPCGEFLAMRSADQDATVAKLLKVRNGRNSSTSDVVAERQAVVASCGTGDRTGTHIGDLG